MQQPLTSAISSGVQLSFGLVTIPVNVHGAVGEDSSQAMRTVCGNHHDLTPISQLYKCPVCESTDRPSFVKAVETAEGFVEIPADEIDKAKAATEPFRKALVVTAHPEGEVSSVLLPSGKTYYLNMKTPSNGALQAYTMLVDLVRRRSDVAFMTKLTLRTSTSIFRLSIAGDTLLLQQMSDAALVREQPKLARQPLSDAVHSMADEITDLALESFVESEHGTGRVTLIQDYAALHAPVAGITAPLVPTKGIALDLGRQLEATLAERQKVASRKTTKKPTRVKKAS